MKLERIELHQSDWAAIRSLPNFTLPGDMSASALYYHRDVAEPNFVLNSDSIL